MTREEYDQLNSDIRSLKEYNDFQEVKNGDSALYSRIINYKKNGIMSLDDMTGLLDEEKRSLPEGSLLLSKKDSLKSEAYKPVETPPQKPEEKTALETLYGVAFPRTQKRMEEKLPLGVGDVASVGLDVASLIPRTVSTIQQAPIDVMNYFVGDKTSEQVPFSTIGETGGRSFQMPNIPAWAPEVVKDAYGVVRPVAEGIGEFGTSVARGPLIPGGSIGSGVRSAGGSILGKPLAYLASKPSTVGDVVRFGGEVAGDVAKASPQALKTALNLIDNLGTGAALGTSESIARGEGVDPFGASLGAGLGALPFIGSKLTDMAAKRSDASMIKGWIDNLKSEYMNLRLKSNKTPEEIASLKAIGENINKFSSQPEMGASLMKIKAQKTAENAARERNLPKPEAYRTLKEMLDDYTSWKGPLKTEPPLVSQDLSKFSPRSSTQELSPEELAVMGRLGRALATKNKLSQLLSGEVLPHTPYNVMRSLPDATIVTPQVIRGGNTLKDYLTNPQDDQRKY